MLVGLVIPMDRGTDLQAVPRPSAGRGLGRRLRLRPIAFARFAVALAGGVTTFVATAGCASIEKGAYGVDDVAIEGVEQMGERRLANCLLTVERPTFGITLGIEPKGCAEPPFDADPPRLSLWSWGWTDYQSFNPAVLEADLQRVIRWYRARGFYDARVVDVRFDPPEAERPGVDVPPGACDIDEEECEVDVTIVVEEGEPLQVGEVQLLGRYLVPTPVQQAVDEAEVPEAGERFDEHHYDRGKQALAEVLAEHGYAAALVKGKVRLDHERKRADVTYRLIPGEPYRFGTVRVHGHGETNAETIVAAADVPPGSPYRASTLTEVQQEVYALGAFTSVRVSAELRRAKHLADIDVHVTPLPKDRWRLGIGIMSGALQRTEQGEQTSVPQWDIHLFGRYERRHIFGTLGKLTIEDRPRLVFQRAFPSIDVPKPGNLVKIRLNEPGLIERRTDAIATTQYDVGPDPFLGFMRHDMLFRIGAKRAFLRRTLFGTLSLQQDVFLVFDGATTVDGSPTPVSYGYSFLEEDLVVDLRDDAARPSQGGYLQLVATQAPRWAGSDWTAFRLTPQIRGYLPLPFQMVLAARFALGAMFIVSASERLDATSAELGPTSYRLRGGGATSNRGFLPGQLGAGLQGGLRRWEASTELRVRLGESFVVALFGDLGDVIRAPELYFTEPNPAVGFGLRYHTPVGAIRFDAGFRVGPVPADADDIPLLGTPGALHLTLGEAY